MFRMTFLIGFILILFSCQSEKGEYVCTPCDLPCDELTFSEVGICPHCNMLLIKRSEIEAPKELILNEINIEEEAGEFLIEAGEGKEGKTIKVFYYKPENYTLDAKILIVIPGAGRNGDSYRDAWIEEAEKYGVLILAPMYSEVDFGFEDYHLCGLLYDIDLQNSIEYVDNSNVAKMKEDKFTYKVNSNPAEWIFNDFDKIFDLVVEATQSTQIDYDIFGHSAGGQILHRLVIFQPKSKANHIIAANSGFYTLPDLDIDLPFGVKNMPNNLIDLSNSFRNKLIILVGELDNQHEKGGTLLRSPTIDQQGLHRLERGQFFFKLAKTIAEEQQLDFNWQLKVIPNVGHNHRAVGDAAAEFLYATKTN